MVTGYGHWFGWGDPHQLLAELAGRKINFRDEEIGDQGWHHDTRRTGLPPENPGEPQPDGSWQIARSLVEAYEMADPRIVRGVYRADVPLSGRDMLLEGRFHGLHFHMGVRVTEIIDESRQGARVWGWSYETLEGHLERGRMAYEVVKHTDTGAVEFVIRAVSQRSPDLGPVVKLGWRLFGRRTQLRFYDGCGARMHRIVSEVVARRTPLPAARVVDGLVHAPSDAASLRRDRLAVRRTHPG